MDFRGLTYVLAIAKHQNITKAADSLYVSQPTLSKFLIALEHDLGLKLFRKLGHRYVLTYEKPTGVHSLEFGVGEFLPTTFPEPHHGDRIGTMDRYYRCMNACAWRMPNSILATVFAVDDYLGTLKMQLTFTGDELTVFMTKYAEDFFYDYRGWLNGRAAKA